MYPLAGYDVGSVFAERFQILSLIGVGGAGAVFRALDLRGAGSEVAIKLIAPRTDGKAAKSGAELLIQNGLAHPNIVKVLDGGVSSDGISFLVMEHLAGCTLRDCLDAAPNGMPLDEALAVLGSIASGLAEAHTHGIVHCDLKPSNILLGNDGQIKIADFGVARLATDSACDTDEPAELPGTPQYMSPEQLDGSPVGVSTDVFSFGALAVELLTGRSPFDGTDLVQLLTRYRRRHPLAHRDLSSSLPLWLRELLVACCASSPSDRPTDAGALYRALVTRSFAPKLERSWWGWLLVTCALEGR